MYFKGFQLVCLYACLFTYVLCEWFSACASTAVSYPAEVSQGLVTGCQA